MPELEVPGAGLHYEAVGSGPMLLGIHGGDGSGNIWKFLGEELKDRFTVVFYDRRGFTESHLTGAQDYAHRLETDADDAARLIRHISPKEPAVAIGSSSGAVVSLKLLARHSDIVRAVLAYEPPAANILPDSKELRALTEEIYDIYRASGTAPAFERFMDLIKADDMMRMGMRSMMFTPDLLRTYNIMYWFEREFIPYPNAEFDVDAELRPHKDKLVLVNGEESNKEAFHYRANVALAEKLGKEVMLFPGGHMGHATHSNAFAAKLVEVLQSKSAGFPKV